MAEPLHVSLSQTLASLAVHVTDKTVVLLPMNEVGMLVLRKILLAREGVEHAVISTPAAPTQEQVNKMIKQFLSSGGTIKVPKIDAPADLSLEDLDLA